MSNANIIFISYSTNRPKKGIVKVISCDCKIDYHENYAKNKDEPKRWKELLQSEIESGESYDDIVNNYNSKENTLEEKKKSPLYYLYKTKTEDIINEDSTSLEDDFVIHTRVPPFRYALGVFAAA